MIFGSISKHVLCKKKYITKNEMFVKKQNCLAQENYFLTHQPWSRLFAKEQQKTKKSLLVGKEFKSKKSFQLTLIGFLDLSVLLFGFYLLSLYIWCLSPLSIFSIYLPSLYLVFISPLSIFSIYLPSLCI